MAAVCLSGKYSTAAHGEAEIKGLLTADDKMRSDPQQSFARNLNFNHKTCS